MDTILYFVYTAAYLVLLILCINFGNRCDVSSLLYLVLFGLVYDNGLIAIGKFIGEGPLLENLSHLRFWFHAFFTPTLVLFSWNVLKRAGFAFAKWKVVYIGALLYTIALVIMEIITETYGMKIVPEREHGLLRYVSADTSTGPPLMVLFVSIALITAGAVLWKRTGWKWMLIGTVVMTVGSAVPIPVESAAITNGFELFLMCTLVATKIHQDRQLKGV
ncbi:hypothetical protein JYA63_08425 [Fictibacillus nanhaiensis]|uniref:Phospholipid phosphatase n=1 Tax=Fictibacillus nanhaiensis TaxID=742169 RepID=A0ABS2ZSB5_9BACL|nr:hypothetical protein [Fictibacillus nanhaiensis]